MATSCVSLFKRRKPKSKLKKSPDNVTSCYQPIKSESSSPADAMTSGSSLKSPPPGTIFTFDNFSGMENALVQRKAAKKLAVESGSPQLLLPIVVIFAEQQYKDKTEKHRHHQSTKMKSIDAKLDAE